MSPGGMSQPALRTRYASLFTIIGAWRFRRGPRMAEARIVPLKRG
jgi:hypothetical protein